MKEVNYRDILSLGHYSEAKILNERALAEFSKFFGLREEDLFEAENTFELDRIFYCLNGSISGKTILDLGCGSNDPYIEGRGIFMDRKYEPWLCRALHIAGARPIGIDIGDLSRERFEHYQRRLDLPGALDGIPDSSVDLVHAFQLFDSPFLNYVLNISGDELKRRLLPQIERVLKPDAYFLHWSGENFDKLI